MNRYYWGVDWAEESHQAWVSDADAAILFYVLNNLLWLDLELVGMTLTSCVTENSECGMRHRLRSESREAHLRGAFADFQPTPVVCSLHSARSFIAPRLPHDKDREISAPGHRSSKIGSRPPMTSD